MRQLRILSVFVAFKNGQKRAKMGKNEQKRAFCPLKMPIPCSAFARRVPSPKVEYAAVPSQPQCKLPRQEASQAAGLGFQKRRVWSPKAPALGSKSTEFGDQKRRVWGPKAPSLGSPEDCIAPASMAPRPCQYGTSTLLVWHYHIVPAELATSRFRSDHLEVRY